MRTALLLVKGTKLTAKKGSHPSPHPSIHPSLPSLLFVYRVFSSFLFPRKPADTRLLPTFSRPASDHSSGNSSHYLCYRSVSLVSPLILPSFPACRLWLRFESHRLQPATDTTHSPFTGAFFPADTNTSFRLPFAITVAATWSSLCNSVSAKIVL